MSDLVRVAAHGVELACLVRGDGPLVVLLHGFPDTATSWDTHAERLAGKGFRVVAPYMRGYAPSGIPATDTVAEDLGRDVLALLDHFGADTARLVGHDWGALGAHAAVGLAEERFSHLVTLAIPHPAAFQPTLSEGWKARHFATYKLPGAHTRFAARDFQGLDAIVARWSPTWTVPTGEFDDLKRAFSEPASLHAAFGYYRALALQPPKFLRKKLALPTLAIGGEHDGAAPARAFELARRKYTGTYEVAMLPCGHFPHRECAEEVWALLDRFLGAPAPS